MQDSNLSDQITKVYVSLAQAHNFPISVNTPTPQKTQKKKTKKKKKERHCNILFKVDSTIKNSKRTIREFILHPYMTYMKNHPIDEKQKKKKESTFILLRISLPPVMTCLFLQNLFLF